MTDKKEKDTKFVSESKNADVADTSLTAQAEYANDGKGEDFDGVRQPDERKEFVPAEPEEVKDDSKTSVKKETDTVEVTSVQSSVPNDSGVKSANPFTNMTSDIEDEEARVYNKVPAKIIEREAENQKKAAEVNKLDSEGDSEDDK